MEQSEQIGKVTLDLSHYPGEDFYCDGPVEDEILEIVKKDSRADYQKRIEEKKKWPVFYHLSPQRENIVSWLPMDRNTKVLEVGSGMGAVTGVLAEKAGSVTCVDLSGKRSRINAYRNRERDNVTIHVGNFNDIEPTLPCDYDYVLLIGVFEYAQSYMPTRNPFEDFMKINLRHVKKGGRLVIAIENKMGMKYWAGCQEDHLATFFAGIEDYPQGGVVRTFTRGGLEKILKNCGIGDYHFYYPYPDYKFADTIYSDRRLPFPGELTRNLRNFDGDRMLLFDEKNAFDMVIREGLFPQFSNSYLLLVGPDTDTVYSKFSNDRADIYAIRTDIREDSKGRREVVKLPDRSRACGHVENIARYADALAKRYEGSGLSINRCRLKQENGRPCACLEYLEGVTLEEKLDECLERGDTEGFLALFGEYLDKIRYHEEVPVSDYDLIFANIIIDKSGQWNLIDYEWTFEERLDTRTVAYRALYCYQMGDGRRKDLPMEQLLTLLELDEKTAEACREREKRFQKAVTGSRISVSDMRMVLGRRAIPWQSFMGAVAQNTAEVFEDYGEGFSPMRSNHIYPGYMVEEKRRLEVPLKAGMTAVRIDPAECSCIIRMESAVLNDRGLPLADRQLFTTNGRELTRRGDRTPAFLFHTGDPQLCISLKGEEWQEGDILKLSFEISRLTEEMASALDGNLKRRHRF